MFLKAQKCISKVEDYTVYSQSMQPESERSLRMLEAQNAKALLDSFDEEFNNPDIKFCYVISSKWFREWKQYTGFDSIVEDNQPDRESFGQHYPSKINQNIVLENYLMTKYPDEGDYRNIFLKQGLEEKRDYELITEAAWKYFAKRYEHIEVKRPIHRFDNAKKLVEVELKQIQIVPVDAYVFRDIDHNNVKVFKTYSILASGYTTISDFKADLVSIHDSKLNAHLFQSDFPITHETSKECLNMWLLDPALDLHTFFKNIQRLCYLSTTYDYSIEFKGQYLERDASLTLNEASIAVEDIIFLDFRFSHKGWVFHGDGAPFLQKCEWCDLYKELKVICDCRKVRYCSEDCQEKDQSFHSRRCQAKKA